MSTEKTFRTLVVATAVTGVGLGKGIRYSDILKLYSHVLGRDVWTHELLDKVGTTEKANMIIRDQLPKLPTEHDADADYKGVAEAVVREYGDTVTLKSVPTEREHHPMETLAGVLRGGE